MVKGKNGIGKKRTKASARERRGSRGKAWASSGDGRLLWWEEGYRGRKDPQWGLGRLDAYWLSVRWLWVPPCRCGGRVPQKTLPAGRKRPHRFFIKRKPNWLNRVEKPPNLSPCPWGPSLAASTVRGFFSLSRLKFASDDNQTQDLLRARRYRAGLAISTARPFAIVCEVKCYFTTIKYEQEMTWPHLYKFHIIYYF